MPRYAPREAITAAAVKRLVSLGSAKGIAQARAAGLPIPADVVPSARAAIDPRTGRLYSRTTVQTAKTFFTSESGEFRREGEPGYFRSMSEATPARAAHERVLRKSGLTFAKGDWAARAERDERVDRIERAYVRRVEREGGRAPRGRSALYRDDSEFREALSRLSAPMPPGLKRWHESRAQELKTRALEDLGLRPRGFQALTGTYTADDLAAAWRRAGVQYIPKLRLKPQREQRRRARGQRT